MDRERIIKRLRGMISEKRLLHSLGVSETAHSLALRFGVDPERAALAGLIHDCARDLGDAELLSKANDAGIPVSYEEKVCPLLLHGPVGAAISRDRFGIEDEQVLRAVAIHTTGATDMGLLDKIVYIADKIEPGRSYQAVSPLRSAAEQGLDEGVAACLAHFMVYLVSKGLVVHPDMVKAWNLLAPQVKGRNFYVK